MESIHVWTQTATPARQDRFAPIPEMLGYLVYDITEERVIAGYRTAQEAIDYIHSDNFLNNKYKAVYIIHGKSWYDAWVDRIECVHKHETGIACICNHDKSIDDIIGVHVMTSDEIKNDNYVYDENTGMPF